MYLFTIIALFIGCDPTWFRTCVKLAARVVCLSHSYLETGFYFLLFLNWPLSVILFRLILNLASLTWLWFPGTTSVAYFTLFLWRWQKVLRTKFKRWKSCGSLITQKFELFTDSLLLISKANLLLIVRLISVWVNLSLTHLHDKFSITMYLATVSHLTWI